MSSSPLPGRSDIAFAESIELAVHDRDAAAAVAEIAQDIRLTSAADHPGVDPVSQQIVQSVTALLRGPDGVEQRLQLITEQLRDDSDALYAAARAYRDADQQSAATLHRLGGQ